MSNRRNTLAYAVAMVLAGTAFAAAAQETVALGLEEVVVTAQRREQSLQDVPIAMQVVDSTLINDVAAENLGDLNGFVPGLVVSGDSPTQPRYQIRGIQTGDFGVGTDPAVGVYVDGIYAARSGASMVAFNDIERIEVLKGPQGTLFGRNSAAGAISIVTRQPANEFDSLLRLRVGQYGKRYYEGMINTPITDSLALRMNGVYNKSDGWMQDAATGKDLKPEDNWAGRAALRWEMSDTTSATVSWDHDDLNQLARPAIGVVPMQSGQMQVPYPADPATYLDPRKAAVYNDVVGNEESRQLDQVNLFIDHSFDWADFRSSSSWRQFDTVNREDEDGTNLIAAYFDTANI
ncbi:MAG: TonB-dependent receptor, partial [Povalibacter sp.]